jgi:hypothetical protein
MRIAHLVAAWLQLENRKKKSDNVGGINNSLKICGLRSSEIG